MLRNYSSKEPKMQPKMPKNQKVPASKRSAGPKKVKNPVETPKVSYVYRKDAFNKVKIA